METLHKMAMVALGTCVQLSVRWGSESVHEFVCDMVDLVDNLADVIF